MSVYFKILSIVLVLLSSVVFAAPKPHKKAEDKAEKELVREENLDEVNSKIEQQIRNKAAKKFVARDDHKDKLQK